ncbi:glycosyltransferase family 9 protein [bacterium]|nr:glycosyltransferase family 9 protein [bacterium]
MTPKRLLLRFPNWLGDIVMAASALEVLHRAGFELRLLIRPPWDALFQHDSRVAEVIPCRDRGFGFFSTVSHLRRRRFNTVVDFTHSLRSGLLWKLAGVARVYREIRPTPARLPPDFRPVHQVTRYLNAIRPLVGSLPEIPPVPHLSIPPGDFVRSDISANHLASSPIPRYSDTPILIFPAAAFGPAKTWSVENYRRLIRSLLDRNWPVRLMGSKSDFTFLSELARPFSLGASRHPSLPFSLSTDLDIPDLMRTISSCHAVISCDSGPAHLAAALGKPVLVLFFSTDPARTIPLGPFVRPVVAEVPCRPCFLRKCPIGYLCRDALTPPQILSALDDLLDVPELISQKK